MNMIAAKVPIGLSVLLTIAILSLTIIQIGGLGAAAASPVNHDISAGHVAALIISGTGSLNASGWAGAGIGGNRGNIGGNVENCGNVTINGGTVTASSHYGGAAIGGGEGGINGGGSIGGNGGTVTAVSKYVEYRPFSKQVR